jgi:hypothetical protein
MSFGARDIPGSSFVYLTDNQIKASKISNTGFCRAQAWKNARSDRVFLDFLFLLHQGKRKDNSKPTNSPISHLDNFIKWPMCIPKK